MALHSTTIAFLPEEVAGLAEQLGVTDEVDLNKLRIGMEVELEHGRRDPLTNVTDDDLPRMPGPAREGGIPGRAAVSHTP